MARGKSSKIKAFEKLMTVMASGEAFTVEQIDALLGKEIYMYRLSNYIYCIKIFANGIVRVVKDGRKIKSYQIINTKEVQNYLYRTGITSQAYKPGNNTTDKKPSIAKLADLGAKQVITKIQETVE